MLLYIRWHAAEAVDSPALPVLEPVAYQYLSSLLDTKKPASRGSQFREAVAFCMGSLGLLEAEAVLASKRCQGASLRLAANKKFVEQRSPFTVAQVEAFEGCNLPPMHC
jgi:hypothetical protein